MSSILTNNGAMVALQTLKGINSSLAKTQDQISTGKDINNQPLTLPLFNDYRVTAADVANKQVSTHVSAAILRQFQTGPVTVQVSVIYEPGAETNYREARFTLEA